MRLYSVHAPREEFSDPERYTFVKDGFSWPALFVPPLFMLWHRLWLTLVYAIVFVLVVGWIGRLAGDGPAALVAGLGLLLFGLEANNIRRLSLEGRGWQEVGASFGRGIGEAEARFFGGKQGASFEAVPAARIAAVTAPREPGGDKAGSGTDEPIIGLFPEPDR